MKVLVKFNNIAMFILLFLPVWSLNIVQNSVYNLKALSKEKWKIKSQDFFWFGAQFKMLWNNEKAIMNGIRLPSIELHTLIWLKKLSLNNYLHTYWKVQSKYFSQYNGILWQTQIQPFFENQQR